MAEENEWQSIETAPKQELVIGLRAARHQDATNYGIIIGKSYDLVRNAVVNEWEGRWAICTHWMPLPKPPVHS